MKQNIITIIILTLSSALHSQITINRSHLVGEGRKVVQATHSGSHDLAAPGTGMNWDFSDLGNDMTDSLRFGLPFWYEGSENFPEATLAYKSFLDDSTVFFLKVTDSEMRFLGFYNMSDSGEMALELNNRTMAFPSTYNTAFNESSKTEFMTMEVGIDPDSTGPLPFIDSIRINIVRDVRSQVNGWGSLETPMGTFQALMQTNLEITSQSFDMKTSGVWVTVPKVLLGLLGFPEVQPDSNYNVNFWTNDAGVGFPLMSYQYRPGETSASEIQWLMARPAASDINTQEKEKVTVYPNPVSDMLHIAMGTASAYVMMFDAQGRAVISTTLNKGEYLNVGHLTPGVYILEIQDEKTGATLAVERIIKD